MKERGLICKDDEVRAILDGRKTVFRRPVTSMRGRGRIIEVREGSRGYAVACTDTKGVVHDIAYHEACDRSPFGVPGDRLWVKEVHKFRIARCMPRWASRILLKVVSVRVDRLHAITEEDARREGCFVDEAQHGPCDDQALDVFMDLWDRNNSKRHAWAENPFVWRVEFRRLP